MKSLGRAQAKVLEAQIALALARSRGGSTSVSPLLALFVDPQNVSGTASDSNSGQTAGTAILTTAEFNRRARLQTAPMTAPTTTLYMSEDLQASGPNPVGLDLRNLILRASYTIQITPVVTKAAGVATLNAGTIGINPTAAGGGQRQTAHTTDLANWAPYVLGVHSLGGTATIPNRLIDQTTGASAWIVDGAASATASLSRPVDPTVTSSPAIAAGAAYEIVRPGVVHLAMTPVPTIDTGTLNFVNCAFTAGSIGPVFQTGFTTLPVAFAHCAFLDALFVGGQFDDCALCDGMQGTSIVLATAGLLLPNAANDEWSGIVNLSGDTYVAGDSPLTVGQASLMTVSVGAPALGVADSGAQIQSIQGESGVDYEQGGALFLGGLLWGNGNSDRGVRVFPGCSLDVQTLSIPTVTGAVAPGDIVFALGGGDIVVARAWNNATGAYTEAGGVATRSTTWAHLVATIAAGGFGGQMHCVESGAAILVAA